jgi:hypothetical protein
VLVKLAMEVEIDLDFDHDYYKNKIKDDVVESDVVEEEIDLLKKDIVRFNCDTKSIKIKSCKKVVQEEIVEAK